MSVTAMTLLFVLGFILLVAGIFLGLSHLIKKEIGQAELPGWTWFVTLIAAVSIPEIIITLVKLTIDIIMWII